MENILRVANLIEKSEILYREQNVLKLTVAIETKYLLPKCYINAC